MTDCEEIGKQLLFVRRPDRFCSLVSSALLGSGIASALQFSLNCSSVNEYSVVEFVAVSTPPVILPSSSSSLYVPHASRKERDGLQHHICLKKKTQSIDKKTKREAHG